MNARFYKTFKLFVYWSIIIQMLWGTVYLPVRAQVPLAGQEAGDWQIYKRVLDEDIEGFVNLLIILDTSDSMNQPESWKAYPGSYNSHVEYLWNDPIFINRIGTTNPPAATSSGSVNASQVKFGYFTYLLQPADASINDQTLQNVNRQILKDAVFADAKGTASVDLDADGTISASAGETGLPKWLYRNYGGPMEYVYTNYNTYRWFHSSWIYFDLSSSTHNIATSPYLSSLSLSKFLGANNQVSGVRAAIFFGGQATNDALSFTSDGYPPLNQSVRTIDFERFNLCDRSRYDINKPRLTGLGVIASGIKPSTIFAPAAPAIRTARISGSQTRDTTSTPTVGYNTGYYKNIEYSRFDPYYESTQTREYFINNYPGPGDFDNSYPETWPVPGSPVATFHNSDDFTFFNHAYADLRCYLSNRGSRLTPTLDSRISFNFLIRCPYRFKISPKRDNFVARQKLYTYRELTAYAAPSSTPSFWGQLFLAGGSKFAPAMGATGLPIRVLRYQFEPRTAGNDDLTSPSTRDLQLNFGACADSTAGNKFGPGGHSDYKCINSTNTALYMTWTKLRSDLGGFNYAHAMYDLYANLKQPSSDQSLSMLTTPSTRLSIVEKALAPYKVPAFTATDSRWGTKNNGRAFVPNNDSRLMFAAYLGNRDCGSITGANYSHCSNTYSEEYRTGVSGYADYTRTTYNFCVNADGTAVDARKAICFGSVASGAGAFSRDHVGPSISVTTISNRRIRNNQISATISATPASSFWGFIGNGMPTSGATTGKSVSSAIAKISIVGVAWDDVDNAVTARVLNFRRQNSNTCTNYNANTTRTYTLNGVVKSYNGRIIASPNDDLYIGYDVQNGSNNRSYHVGDDGFVSTTNQALVKVPTPIGTSRRYFNIVFGSDRCARLLQFDVAVGNASAQVALPVRSNTYKVFDPNYGAYIGANNQNLPTAGSSRRISGDVSDTIGMVLPHDVFNGVLAHGALEIRSNNSNIPPNYKRYRRYVDCGKPNRNNMALVWAGYPVFNKTNFYFTGATCDASSWLDNNGATYTAGSDCQVTTGASGQWIFEPAQSLCAGLAAPTCRYIPSSNAAVAQVYPNYGCKTFSKTNSYEGASITQSGRSCSLVKNKDVYIIDWDDTDSYDTNALVGLYNNFDFSSWQKPATKIDNFYNINTFKGGFSPFTNIYSPNSPYVAPVGDKNLCNYSESLTKVGGFDQPEGFEPVFYKGAPGTYEVYNIRAGSFCSANLQYIYFNRDITDPAFPSSSSIISMYGGAMEAGFGNNAQTLAEADVVKNDSRINVGTCNSDIKYSASWRELRDIDYVSPTVSSNVRLFEAYNVLKHGSENYKANSALSKPEAGGGYFPHFIHTCAPTSTPSNATLATTFYGIPISTNLLAGSKSNWDSTAGSSQNNVAFDQFQTAKLKIDDLLKPSYSINSEPAASSYTAVLDAASGGTVSAGTSGNGSMIDLYSVNYLNFVFGPKYNGSPIGRRTRYQLAQDTLAEFIGATEAQIRIGLMFFNQPDSLDKITSGGYVARAIERLEPKVCPTTYVRMSVSSDGLTLTPRDNIDSWFERTPTPSSAAIIPDTVRHNLVTGGTIKFPNRAGVVFEPIKMGGIDDNGVITLTSPAPSWHGANVGVTMENCNLGNFESITGHRRALIDTIYRKLATAQTPLTETLYEAYLYYNGGVPRFGRYVDEAQTKNGSPEADVNAFTDNTYNRYISPITTIVGPISGVDYSSCANNNILLITDGYSFGDGKANQDIINIMANGNASTDLINDQSGNFKPANEIIQTQTYADDGSVFLPWHFNDPSKGDPTLGTGGAYGPPDGAYTSLPGLSSAESFSLFDELAYYIGNGNIAPSSVNSLQDIKLFTAALDIDCSPVIKNAVYRNRRGNCAEIQTGSDDLAALLKSLLSSLNEWVPAANVAAIPLPAVNRSNSSIETYMGLFSPTNNQMWVGNMKKYRLAFGPVECGLDSSGHPIDVCITGRNVLESYSAGSNLGVRSRNILSRQNSEDDITINPSAIDYWSTTTPSTATSEGSVASLGGVSSRIVDNAFPAGTNVYTFLPTSVNTSVTSDLTAADNLVSTGNAKLAVTANFGQIDRFGNFFQMPPLEDPDNVINFMLGADPANPAVLNVRSAPHGDVMHSSPATITYKSGNSLMSRVFYLTGLGDLVSVNDSEGTVANGGFTANNANDGNVAWRFYPFESLRRQHEVMTKFNQQPADLKIFAADGGVNSIVFDKNGDGYIEAAADDKAYIAFGMRRGGRAVYVLDITDPDSPFIQWKMSNEEICRHSSSGTFYCSLAADYLAANPTVPANMFSELGFTWSTPLTGFVNSKPQAGTAYDAIFDIKGKKPVVIFGGGYDPEEDNLSRNSDNYQMGRALYVMDAVLGEPVKIWSRTNSVGSNVGIMIRNSNNGYYDINSPGIDVLAPACRTDISPSVNKIVHPIASAVYGMNVDYDAANTIDRLYVGDLGGQLFRFDIGEEDNARLGIVGTDYWRATLMANFNGKTTSSEPEYSITRNNVRVDSRKIFTPPVVATWTRTDANGDDQIFNYIYGVTGDIEHPWRTDTQDIAFALVDPEVGLRMRCAPTRIAQVDKINGSFVLGNRPDDTIFNLLDITLEGRVDRGSRAAFNVPDGIIDLYDIPLAANISNPTASNSSRRVSREQLSRAPEYVLPNKRLRPRGIYSAPIFDKGVMGWFYRMETGEKAVAGARVINGKFTWTAFAANFKGSVCTRGTGTKYYLDAFWGTTVDTNNDGVVSNCLSISNYNQAYRRTLLENTINNAIGLSQAKLDVAERFEARLRTPIAAGNFAGAGATSLACDSPRPIYNTSYGLLQNDVQVIHDGIIFRVGLVPSGNENDLAYDEFGNFLGFNFRRSLPTGGVTTKNGASTPSSLQTGETINEDGTRSLGKVPTLRDSSGNVINLNTLSGGQAAGIAESNQVRPSQTYWFRDDLN